MKPVLDFIYKNWYYLLLAVLAVATFAVSLILAIKKNKNSGNIFDSIKAALMENIPFWAVISEGLSGGDNKKNNVITLGIALVNKLLGRKLSADENDYFVAFISEQLEKVLATPQKKLQAPKKAEEGRYRVK